MSRSAVRVVVLIVFAGVLAGCGSSDDSARVDVTMQEFTFTPSTIEVPAEEDVELVLRNEDNVAHDFQAGRAVMEADDRPVGFEQDLFEGVAVEVEPRSARAMVDGQRVISVPPGGEVQLRFRLPADKAGEWRIGCFHAGGCHYVAGLHGDLIVEA